MAVKKGAKAKARTKAVEDQATKADHASELGHDATDVSDGTDHPSATPQQTHHQPSQKLLPRQANRGRLACGDKATRSSVHPTALPMHRHRAV